MKFLLKTFLITFTLIQAVQAGRYYNSEDGRFISRDPLGYVDGMSLYNAYFAERFAQDPNGTLFRDNSKISIGNDGALYTKNVNALIGWSCHECSKDEEGMRKNIDPVDAGRDSAHSSQEELGAGLPEHLIDKANENNDPQSNEPCYKMLLRDFIVDAWYTVYSNNFSNTGNTYIRADGRYVHGLRTEIEFQQNYIHRAKIWYNANISTVKAVFETGCLFKSLKACREYGENLSLAFNIHLRNYVNSESHPFSLGNGPGVQIE